MYARDQKEWRNSERTEKHLLVAYPVREPAAGDARERRRESHGEERRAARMEKRRQRREKSERRRSRQELTAEGQACMERPTAAQEQFNDDDAAARQERLARARAWRASMNLDP